MRGTVYRIRIQGGINHPYLKAFINEEGNRWRLWGGRNLSRGVPAFPAGRPTPSFPYTSGNRRKKSEFDNALSYQSWYSNWTSTCLGINRHDAPAYTRSLLHILSEKGVLNTHTTKSGATVYSLKPADILVASTPSGQPAEVLECDTCGSIYPAGDCSLSQLDGAPCHAPDAWHPSPRHRTQLLPRLLQQQTQPTCRHEHTSLLDNDERRNRRPLQTKPAPPTPPNVLVATPTQRWHDIGDLSTVMLSSFRSPTIPAHRSRRPPRRQPRHHPRRYGETSPNCMNRSTPLRGKSAHQQHFWMHKKSCNGSSSPTY